jgi:hypothetical protein
MRGGGLPLNKNSCMWNMLSTCSVVSGTCSTPAAAAAVVQLPPVLSARLPAQVMLFMCAHQPSNRSQYGKWLHQCRVADRVQSKGSKGSAVHVMQYIADSPKGLAGACLTSSNTHFWRALASEAPLYLATHHRHCSVRAMCRQPPITFASWDMHCWTDACNSAGPPSNHCMCKTQHTVVITRGL